MDEIHVQIISDIALDIFGSLYAVRSSTVMSLISAFQRASLHLQASLSDLKRVNLKIKNAHDVLDCSNNSELLKLSHFSPFSTAYTDRYFSQLMFYHVR